MTPRSKIRYFRRVKQRITPGPYRQYQSVPHQVQGSLLRECLSRYQSAYSRLVGYGCQQRFMRRQSNSLFFPAFIQMIQSTILIMSIGNIARIKIPQNCNINIKDVTIMKQVPKEASFCEVKIVKYCDQICALKIIHKKMIPPAQFEEQYNRLQNEITILYTLKHPNIVKLYFHEENEDDILLLMQYGGTRIWGLFKRKKLTEDEVKDLLRQILKGLKEIHDNGFIHRDISPENILVNRQNQVKIVDFGFATETRGRYTNIGTFIYMAPEISGDNNYNHKVDIWSLGILAYEMFHQDLPFCQRKNFEEAAFIQNRNKANFVLSPQLSPEAADILKRMIMLNPQKRANVDQLLNHPFLKVQEEQSDFFDNLNQTQKIQRKTQKNNIYLREREQKVQQVSHSQKTIQEQQKEMRRSINEIFASLHHQKDIFSQLIKNYKQLLKKNVLSKQKYS